MKNKLFASVPNILFGALITIAPQTFAHACTGHDMPGACHYSQQAATGIGVVILVFGVVALFVAPQIRIEQTAGAQPFRTLDSGLAYCNRTISNIRIHRAIPYRIARPSD